MHILFDRNTLEVIATIGTEEDVANMREMNLSLNNKSL